MLSQDNSQTAFPSEAVAAERQADIDQQNEFHDLLKDMMYKVSGRQANSTAVAHIALATVVAPLLTLSTSLQCSIPINRVTMENLNPNQYAATQGSRKA